MQNVVVTIHCVWKWQNCIANSTGVFQLLLVDKAFAQPTTRDTRKEFGRSKSSTADMAVVDDGLHYKGQPTVLILIIHTGGKWLINSYGWILKKIILFYL